MKIHEKSPPWQRYGETKETSGNATRQESIGRTAGRDRQNEKGTRYGQWNPERKREKSIAKI